MRIYYFGTDAFSYSQMSSFGLLIDSDLVQRAENTDIYYELKPGLDTVFMGKRFVTNSRGLADDEYPLAKPDGTYRVAVVGSSWTMATSVEYPDAYHSILERKLAEQLAPQKVEFINFGVENYGLSEIVANIRYKALDYDPDMIMLAITSLTPVFLWDDEKPPFEPTQMVPVFWQSYLYSAVMEMLGKTSYQHTVRPSVKQDRGGYMTQVWRSLKELQELTEGKDIDVVILWLTKKGHNPSMLKATSYYAGVRKFRLVHADLDDLAKEYDVESESLVPALYPSHANEAGQQLIAEKIFSNVWGEGSRSD